LLAGDLLAIEFGELLGRLGAGDRVEGAELDLRTISGRNVPTEIWGAPLGQDGRESVMVGLDISERRLAEEERKELEHRTGRARRMEAVGRLSGVIAHDFNNLLAAIQGYLELARTRDDIELVRQDLMVIADGAQRAVKLTRQLLTFSHGQPQSHKIIDVCEVVRDLSGLLEQLVSTDRVFRLEFPAAPIFVSIEGSALEQVIVNLVINARDATPAGGEVKVSVRSRRDLENHTRLSDMAPLNGHLCEITVTDSGAGISPEIADRIFEPFFTTKESHGTGLGLATVYAIVQKAGGDVTVESDAEHGSVFRVVLPELIGVDADKKPEPTASPSGLPHCGTILVVDDEEPFRRYVVEVLSREGYTVFSAPDARRALVLVDAQPDRIDLLLTDLAMPGMSGTTLASRLSHLPVVFMSGFFTGADEVGDRPFVQKPFTPDELLAAVERALPAATSIKQPRDATRV
ncbi:MAG: ATP-binding protein, partial [Phycisphaerales bacterium]|nr:ATP-binding protein [Phycisphaerales bacterium]